MSKKSKKAAAKKRAAAKKNNTAKKRQSAPQPSAAENKQKARLQLQMDAEQAPHLPAHQPQAPGIVLTVRPGAIAEAAAASAEVAEAAEVIETAEVAETAAAAAAEPEITSPAAEKVHEAHEAEKIEEAEEVHISEAAPDAEAASAAETSIAGLEAALLSGHAAAPPVPEAESAAEPPAAGLSEQLEQRLERIQQLEQQLEQEMESHAPAAALSTHADRFTGSRPENSRAAAKAARSSPAQSKARSKAQAPSRAAARPRRRLRSWVWVALLLLVVGLGFGLSHLLIPSAPADALANAGLNDTTDTTDTTDATDTTNTADTPGLSDTADTTDTADASDTTDTGAGKLWLSKLTPREMAQRRGEEIYYEQGIAYKTATAERMPVLALTFDDGPSIYTESLLQGLEERGIKATFFMLGQRAELYPEIVAEMAEQGHLLASHGWDHRNSLTRMSEQQIDDELSRTAEAIYTAGGAYPLYLRPPYGDINKTTAALIDYPMMLWTIDPRDWDVKNADKVCQNIVDAAYDGGVILAHDIYDTTVQGVLCAIDILLQQGYQFVRLDDYYRIFGITPQNGEVWRGTSQANI